MYFTAYICFDRSLLAGLKNHRNGTGSIARKRESGTWIKYTQKIQERYQVRGPSKD